MKTRLMVGTITLVFLAACGGASTPASNTAATETATATFIATQTPAATATAALLPISPTASAYLEEALDIMQKHSLNRYSVDWDALRTATFNVARHAQTPADTYGAIRYALFRLGDQHSSFASPKEIAQAQQATMSDMPVPRGKLLMEKIGFIAIEGFGNAIPGEARKYATSVQQLIRDLDAQNPCGWIVDVRENTGGNMWPMLAGLGPILGEGKVGAFVDPDGGTVDWTYQDGEALLGDYVFTHVNGPAYHLKAASPPVAVLTGVYTASAGEAIVVAFRERPDTRSFGLYTTGLSTGNAGFPLSDGAVINLTVAVYADRTGQTYGDSIYPDELVDDVRKYSYVMEEAIPQPALDWLMAQPACTAHN